MSAHNQAVQCATTRIVIDSYEKQIKRLEQSAGRLEQRLLHAEEEVHNLRKIVNTFETYNEDRRSA